ncbi:MAG: DUF3021 domain-containing protein [Aerococcus sp.]|nr:DUF3021 domain-containing protein [Aerococcus sp.]
MFKAIIQRSVIGMLLGECIGLWLSILFSGINTHWTYYASLPTQSFTWQMMLTSSLLWALLGMWMSVASLLFDYIESLQTATFLHALAIYIPLVLVAFHEHWLTLETLPLFTLTAIVIYIIIWFSFYHYYKHLAEQLNAKLPLK